MQFFLNLQKAGFTLEDILKLNRNPRVLESMRTGMLNDPKFQTLIDCDAAPYCPGDLEIRAKDQPKCRVRGELEFDPSKVALHLDGSQKNGKQIIGRKLLKLLKNQTVALPANVLEHLLANTNLIPESWKQDELGQTLVIHFCGTIYSDSIGGLYVRSLRFLNNQWGQYYSCLDHYFGDAGPAAILIP
ncbi:TPA: hypothetical protein DCZ32_04025 [Candidatus Uhrbacteria bacterium]|nr:hypothetical protein [Candidatus Uhrbacteria bacterium]